MIQIVHEEKNLYYNFILIGNICIEIPDIRFKNHMMPLKSGMTEDSL